MVCTFQTMDGGGIHDVRLHAREGLVRAEPNLLAAWRRNGVTLTDWSPLSDGEPVVGLVMATPRVVTGGRLVRIRPVRPGDLVEEAA